MNPTPSPGPVDVVVHSGPADWWVILTGLGPLAVLVAALLAFYINWRTLKQRTAADKTALEQRRDADANALAQKTATDSRAEWWRRTQWALDRALDEDEGTKALGLARVVVLAHSDLARMEELVLFDIACTSVSPPDENDDDGGNGQPEEQTPSVASQRERFDAYPWVASLQFVNSTKNQVGHFTDWLIRRTQLKDPQAGPTAPGIVDSDDNIGDNKTTDEDKTKEGGQ